MYTMKQTLYIICDTAHGILLHLRSSVPSRNPRYHADQSHDL